MENNNNIGGNSAAESKAVRSALADQAKQTDGGSPTGSPGNRKYWFLVLFLVVLSALGSFVNDMYTPALPAMCRFFGCAVPVAQLGLTMGMIGLGAGQLILGPLSDRYGRKPVLIGSVALFIAAAVASVFSPNIHVFNICRLFQGLGASGGYFLARTIPADLYSGRALAKLMALTGAINGVAPACAPVVGGVTADHWGWKGVFLLLAGFAVVILLLSPMLKESLPLSRRTKGAWWRTMKGYRVLLRNRPFMIHVCFKGTALGMLFAYISSAPYILQSHYGLNQTDFGLVIGFNSIFAAVGAMLAMKFKPLKRAARTGTFILMVGTAAQFAALMWIHSIVAYEICMALMLFGLGLIFTTTNTLAMNEGRERAGEASSLLGVSGYVFGAVVAPIVGMGDILHSSAFTFLVLAVFVFVCSGGSHRLAPDLEK